MTINELNSVRSATSMAYGRSSSQGVDLTIPGQASNQERTTLLGSSVRQLARQFPPTIMDGFNSVRQGEFWRQLRFLRLVAFNKQLKPVKQAQRIKHYQFIKMPQRS